MMACLLSGLLYAAFTQAREAAPGSAAEIARIQSQAADVEALVALTKPADWAPIHSCLYYAMAGQYLLARQGVSARLVVGTVIYRPHAAGQHRINPHAWLETGSYLIDPSALPRWGEITVIPLRLVARRFTDIRPGFTALLTIRRQTSPELRDYLAVHRAHFMRALAAQEQ